ncbi:MAG: hypothetical protein JKY52_18670 [Flavobacteriales bacterium]|nr:hypothetical protein [Flavobacteriales bacterium]
MDKLANAGKLRKTLKLLGFWVVFWFVFLFIISLQFDYAVLPNIGKITAPVFRGIGEWLGYSSEYGLVSDSREMYQHTLLLIPLSVLIAMFSFWLDQGGVYHERMKYWFHVGGAYFLALQLFKYGFDKLFKHQFYLPEPNTLFTPLGYLSKDILYWSTMGASYSYNVFMGLLEIIPAIMLLFRPTRLVGTLSTVAVMLNVLMVNIGFDISVKLYSAFLLFLGMLLVVPSIKRLYHVLILNQAVQLQSTFSIIKTRNQAFLVSVSKSLVVGLILYESLFMFFRTNNFNDDLAERSLLHGAYDVQIFKRNGDTLSLHVDQENLLKRIFFHRSGYFITQTMNDQMQDYQLTLPLVSWQLIGRKNEVLSVVLDYQYAVKDSLLKLNGTIAGDSISIVAKKVNSRGLPLFQEQFNWTVQGHIEAMNHYK